MKIRLRSLLRRCLVILFIGSLTSVLWLQPVHSVDPARLVQQGIEQYQSGNFKGAIAVWQTVLTAYDKDPVNRAIVLENLARAYQQSNQNSEAIKKWEQLIKLYQQNKNAPKLSQALVEQAQLYSRIGQPRNAIALLCAPKDGKCINGSAVQLAEQSQDKNIAAAALGSLGDAYRLSGSYDLAIEQLTKALDLPQNNLSYRISALNGIANAYLNRAKLSARRAESAKSRTQILAGEQPLQGEASRLAQLATDDENQAIAKLNESLSLTRSQQDRQGELRSLISLIPIYQKNNNPLAISTIQQAIALLDQIPENRTPENRVLLYATIDLARLTDSAQAERLLERAIDLATTLKDDRAKSFALGELGNLYERQNQNEKALSLTRQAVLIADQRQDTKDSLYRWEWQTGRLLAKNPKNTEVAIASYERAIQTLEEIRSDILSANIDLQFDFRKTVEPVYRELITLRLSLEKDSPRQTKQIQTNQQAQSKANIALVLTAMDSLRLAELQNYFGNECVLAAINRLPSNATTEENKSAAIQNVLSSSTQNQKTAVLNHIMLDDQLIVVLNLPNNQQYTVPVPATKAEMEEKIKRFRNVLETFRDRQDFDLTLSKELYKDLIFPVQDYLAAAKEIDTLVFVQDGLLRSIPMSALHDGNQYLIQKYAIATTPSLSLIDLTPFKRSDLRALALGVTKDIQLTDTQRFYKALEYAKDELDFIVAELPGSRKFELLKSDLKNRLQEQPYPIIHIATHGQFGADPKDTFLVTGEGKRLTIEEFEQLLRDRIDPRDPIDLLMLTACQTGTGDDRATLGLAGVAIQAGAKSALASLWFVNDESTANLVKQFYRNLKNPTLTKAKAVQEAQKALIAEDAHPAFWSAFILVGNWL